MPHFHSIFHSRVTCYSLILLHFHSLDELVYSLALKELKTVLSVITFQSLNICRDKEICLRKCASMLRIATNLQNVFPRGAKPVQYGHAYYRPWNLHLHPRVEVSVPSCTTFAWSFPSAPLLLQLASSRCSLAHAPQRHSSLGVAW